MVALVLHMLKFLLVLILLTVWVWTPWYSFLVMSVRVLEVLYMGVYHFLRIKEFYISIVLNKFFIYSKMKTFVLLCPILSLHFYLFGVLMCMHSTVLVWRSEASIVEVIRSIPFLSHFNLFCMCMSELAWEQLCQFISLLLPWRSWDLNSLPKAWHLSPQSHLANLPYV